LKDGTVFMTRGCPSTTGDIACNRPYANEWPDEVLRNYPFYPNEDDLALIRETVALG
jgi:biotin synthase